MPYMMLPGARLVVGPHGELEESLGACCAACALAGVDLKARALAAGMPAPLPDAGPYYYVKLAAVGLALTGVAAGFLIGRKGRRRR